MSASEAQLLTAWEQLARLRPRLASQARVSRHRYRGEDWFVVEDPASGQVHRLRAPAHGVIDKMDGVRSAHEIREELEAELGDEAPTPVEMVQLLSRLQGAGLLRGETAAAEKLIERSERQRRARWQQRLLAPLALRVPLVDPSPLLEWGLPFVRPLFGRAGALAWLLLMLATAIAVGPSWPGLAEHASERALAPGNLLLLWLLYPLVKVLHELGHAFATRAWGGRVHEMGITLLVLTPVPYVDASASSAFVDKRRRMIVGAAGVAVELVLAALAFWLWHGIGAGTLRDAALDVMLICSVSTVLFNGNPLLRFDAYYVLSDALEIPNLATRSRRTLARVAERRLFGLEDTEPEIEAPGERPWLVAYGIASSVYRVFVLFAIALFLAGRFFVLGVLLAVWTVAAQILAPAFRHALFVARDPRLEGRRARALSISLGGVALAGVLLFAVPMPSSTVAEGVLRLPERARVRAHRDGFLVSLLQADGAAVEAGQPLFETRDPALQLHVAQLEWRLRDLETQRVSHLLEDRFESGLLLTQISEVKGELDEARSRRDELVIESPDAGILIVPEARHLPGRFVRRGDTLGYVIDPAQATARVVVPQTDVGRVRERTRAVEIRLVQRPGRVVSARIERELPLATDLLPSGALGSRAGGAVPVDVRDDQGVHALDPVFQLDLTLDEPVAEYFPGSRVHVRFEHEAEPLGRRWARRLRQLFLRQPS